MGIGFTLSPQESRGGHLPQQRMTSLRALCIVSAILQGLLALVKSIGILGCATPFCTQQMEGAVAVENGGRMPTTEFSSVLLGCVRCFNEGEASSAARL